LAASIYNSDLSQVFLFDLTQFVTGIPPTIAQFGGVARVPGFGSSLEMSDTLLAIGDPQNNFGNGQVFLYDLQSDFSLLLTILLLDFSFPQNFNAYFGFSIAIGTDTIAVGAPFTDFLTFSGDLPGYVQVFNRNQGGPGVWGTIKLLDPVVENLPLPQGFGRSVSITQNDTFIAVSSPLGLQEAFYIFNISQPQKFSVMTVGQISSLNIAQYQTDLTFAQVAQNYLNSPDTASLPMRHIAYSGALFGGNFGLEGDGTVVFREGSKLCMVEEPDTLNTLNMNMKAAKARWINYTSNNKTGKRINISN